MKRIFVLILLLWSNVNFAQDIRMYTWREALSANPDSVYGITFEKMKLKSLPDELKNFTQIKRLNLGKNKLVKIPNYVGDMSNLTYLNAERNQLTSFPIVVCRLTALEQLIVNRNNISEVPACIEYATGLEYIDVYDNPITKLPESLMNMGNLKKIDFTGIRFSPKFQDSWKERLPSVELIFDAPCDCMN